MSAAQASSVSAAIIRHHMPPFARIYTDEQKDAVAHAYEDRRITPARVVRELALKGELVDGMAPFDMPIATIRYEVQRLRKRRAGVTKSKTAELPDAVQVLRRRLLSMTDQELAVEERKKPGKRDPERMRQLARALREAAAIPEKGTAPAPGSRSRDTGAMDNGGATEGGLAGAILAAARGTGTRPEPTPSQAAA